MPVEAVFRREYGRCVATLIRFLGDIDAAEEAVQDAFTVALASWPSGGQPPNPGAWIVTTARNRAIDRLRRESLRDQRHAQAHHLYGTAAGETPPPRLLGIRLRQAGRGVERENVVAVRGVQHAVGEGGLGQVEGGRGIRVAPQPALDA